MKFFLLVVMLVPCAVLAELKDPVASLPPPPAGKNLKDKMLSFTKQNGTNIVTVSAMDGALGPATVCARFFTDGSGDFDVFSIATASGLPQMKLTRLTNKGYRLSGVEKSEEFTLYDSKLNRWHSVCATLNRKNGIGQIWLNGYPSVRKFVDTGSSEGPYLLTLGQSEATSGESFVGMITDVNAWYSILSPCELQSFMEDGILTIRDMIDWENVLYETRGSAIKEDDQRECWKF